MEIHSIAVKTCHLKPKMLGCHISLELKCATRNHSVSIQIRLGTFAAFNPLFSSIYCLLVVSTVIHNFISNWNQIVCFLPLCFVTVQRKQMAFLGN